MRGFFSKKELSGPKLGIRVPQCGLCGLHKKCETPKMPVTGKGRTGTLVVAEAPGRTEDEQGVQLIGPAGQELRKHLRAIGIDLDRDCWKTNAVICRPPGNVTPTKEIEYCRPNLLKAIRKLQPTRVVLLGAVATKALLEPTWTSDGNFSVGRWAGWQIPSGRYQTWLCPTYHSSYLMRKKEPVLDLWFQKHLRDAFAKKHPPSTPPDYQRMVEQLTPPEAAAAIHYMRDFPGHAAFDYETNMLKPDHKNARIICCSIAWGNEDGVTRCISFPIDGVSKKALGRFIRSPIEKIASNIKFEDRWTRRFFGHRVRNWMWDTMQSAHVLDNRKAITSVKFQAYVRLGVEGYDDAVSKYLEADGGNVMNKVQTHVHRDDLLTYCGMDSIVELEVANHQMQEMGFEVTT